MASDECWVAMDASLPDGPEEPEELAGEDDESDEPFPSDLFTHVVPKEEKPRPDALLEPTVDQPGPSTAAEDEPAYFNEPQAVQPKGRLVRANVVQATPRQTVLCPYCPGIYQKQGLLRHIQSAHQGFHLPPTLIDKSFHCIECDRYFATDHTLRGHRQNVHFESQTAGLLQCSACPSRPISQQALAQHYATSHYTKYETFKLRNSLYEDQQSFLNWLARIESASKHCFFVHTAQKGEYVKYRCWVTGVDGKDAGTVSCPAYIEMFFNNTGVFSKYQLSHDHEPDRDLARTVKAKFAIVESELEPGKMAVALAERAAAEGQSPVPKKPAKKNGKIEPNVSDPTFPSLIRVPLASSVPAKKSAAENPGASKPYNPPTTTSLKRMLGDAGITSVAANPHVAKLAPPLPHTLKRKFPAVSDSLYLIGKPPLTLDGAAKRFHSENIGFYKPPMRQSAPEVQNISNPPKTLDDSKSGPRIIRRANLAPTGNQGVDTAKIQLSKAAPPVPIVPPKIPRITEAPEPMIPASKTSAFPSKAPIIVQQPANTGPRIMRRIINGATPSTSAPVSASPAASQAPIMMRRMIQPTATSSTSVPPIPKMSPVLARSAQRVILNDAMRRITGERLIRSTSKPDSPEKPPGIGPQATIAAPTTMRRITQETPARPQAKPNTPEKPPVIETPTTSTAPATSSAAQKPVLPLKQDQINGSANEKPDNHVLGQKFWNLSNARTRQQHREWYFDPDVAEELKTREELQRRARAAEESRPAVIYMGPVSASLRRMPKELEIKLNAEGEAPVAIETDMSDKPDQSQRAKSTEPEKTKASSSSGSMPFPENDGTSSQGSNYGTFPEPTVLAKKPKTGFPPLAQNGTSLMTPDEMRRMIHWNYTPAEKQLWVREEHEEGMEEAESTDGELGPETRKIASETVTEEKPAKASSSETRSPQVVRRTMVLRRVSKEAPAEIKATKPEPIEVAEDQQSSTCRVVYCRVVSPASSTENTSSPGLTSSGLDFGPYFAKVAEAIPPVQLQPNGPLIGQERWWIKHFPAPFSNTLFDAESPCSPEAPAEAAPRAADVEDPILTLGEKLRADYPEVTFNEPKSTYLTRLPPKLRREFLFRVGYFQPGFPLYYDGEKRKKWYEMRFRYALTAPQEAELDAMLEEADHQRKIKAELKRQRKLAKSRRRYWRRKSDPVEHEAYLKRKRASYELKKRREDQAKKKAQKLAGLGEEGEPEEKEAEKSETDEHEPEKDEPDEEEVEKSETDEHEPEEDEEELGDEDWTHFL